MEQDLNFESLGNMSVDITTLDNVDQSKMDVLESLGVMSASSYNASLPEEKSENDVVLDAIEKQVSTITIDTNVSEPNIILSKAELVRALRYAGVMIKKVTNDIESSSLNITFKDDGKVEYRLKDNMTWVTIEGTCKVANNNPLIKTLSFNTTYLTKLLSAAAEDFLIYEGTALDQKQEEKNVLYARLINGDFIIDYFEGNEAKLVPSGNKTDKLGSVPASVVSTLCDVMIPLIADTQEVQSKRTVIYEDRAFFRSATYLLEFNNTFSRMCLGKKELDLLKLVATSAGQNEIEIYSTDSNGENRIVFVGPNVTISTAVSIPNRDEVVIARFNELENAKYMKISKDDFKRVLFLSGLGTGNVARVAMNYNIDGAGIDAETIGKDGNSKFNIAGENYNNLEPRSEAVIVYAPQISTLLKSFESGKDLQIAFLTNGVAFYDSTLGIRAIMNYAR